MLPILAAAIPAAIGAGAAYLGQKSANRETRDLAREQMAFQERMSGTAYQRAVNDMRMAGINPMLAYQQGGASSPSGQTAKMENAIGPAVSSALSVVRLKKELELMEAQKYKTEMDAYAAMSTGALTQTRNLIEGFGVQAMPGGVVTPYGALLRKMQYAVARSQEGLNNAQRRILEYGYPAAEVSGKKFAAWIRLLGGSAAGAALMKGMVR